MEHIRRCPTCRRYTMEKNCLLCGKETALARPPKFSLNSKYAGLIREAKRKELQERELL